VARSDLKHLFGVSVKIWRSRLGISQEELAGRAGLHRTYVSDIERGARNVSLESISKLARALEVSVATLFSDSDKTTSATVSDELVDILFVEDNPDDVQLTLRALKAANITNRIQVVRDGEAALQFLFCKGPYADRQPDQRPQVILLDLGLPKMGGLEVLRRIRAEPRTRSIPVVVLTASRHDRDVLASKQLGAEAYIVKPVDFQNLSEVTPQLSLYWALLKPVTGMLQKGRNLVTNGR
jgi:CheY-like chemotaxis protein/DNA-binding transcriptional regulator YdaS (Cro superfamily)